MAGADTSRDDDELADAKEAHDRACEAWADNYAAALDDFRFARLHEHWPESIRKQREDDGRPCLTVPKLPAFIRQVVNDARQNKPAISVHPVDSAADPETAEIFNGLIRHIEQVSDADVAYDTALEHAVTGGFGFWKLNTVYTSDDSFDQDIVIEQVSNPFSITPDPRSTAADSADWNEAWETDSYSRDAFKDRWKDAEAVSWEGKGVQMTPDADEDENVTVCVRWMRERAVRQIVALTPPRLDAPQEAVAEAMNRDLLPESLIIDLAMYEANKPLFDALGVAIIGQPRAVPTFKVSQTLYSGAEALETNDWAGRYIPIVPVFGVDLNIEGKRYLEGLVRPAKDEQRRYNFELSAATEMSGLAPKAPWVGPVGAFETDAAKWASMNVENHAYVEYDLVNGGAAPQRQGFDGVPAAKMQLALTASDNMKAIMGLHDASLGARSNETSGKAILARQREGDVSSFHFIDNLSRAIRHTGRIALDLIPKVYSTPRILRVLGPDGEAQSVKTGPRPVGEEPPNQVEQIGEIERIYDLGAGKYDLTVRAGPSFSTRREESASQMMEMMRVYPQAAPIVADLLAKNLDWPGADELADRFQAMLPAALQGQDPQAQALQAQLKQLADALGQAKAKITELETDRSIDARKSDIDAFNAETNRLKAIAGKDGAGFDPMQMAPVVAASLAHIFQSPDILAMAQGGAAPEQIMAAMAQRIGQGGPPPAEPGMAA